MFAVVHKQYRYADKLDIFLLILGSLSAIGNGMAWPYSMVVMGSVIDDFVLQGKYEALLDISEDYLTSINMTKEELRTNPLRLK